MVLLVDDIMFVRTERDNLDMSSVVTISDDLGVKSNSEKFDDFDYEQKVLVLCGMAEIKLYL